jgi:hypothetical protein
MVALIVVLAQAAITIKPRTSLSRSNELSNPAHRSNHAPTIASSVLPSAMPHAVQIGSLAVAFAKNAPNQTPGQMA